MSRIIERAREVIDIEIEGLAAVRDHLDDRFELLVALCRETLANGGKLVLTGIGKSGYIGKKMAATLSSLGSPAVFMHPVEALHGDLGMMQAFDLILALSYSGETDELLNVIRPAKRLGMKLVAIVGSEDSTLAQLSDLVVPMTVPREACPFKLAPTTTTTALLALGDALALVLLEQNAFTKDDYGRLHPGGAIGRMVTLRALDMMRPEGRWVVLHPETPVREAICRMGQARCGSTVVVDGAGKLLGIFTDGDFRRWAEKDMAVLTRTLGEVMTPAPKSIPDTALAVEVVKMVEKHRINDIVVVDSNGCVRGLIDVQDLPGLKLM